MRPGGNARRANQSGREGGLNKLLYVAREDFFACSGRPSENCDLLLVVFFLFWSLVQQLQLLLCTEFDVLLRCSLCGTVDSFQEVLFLVGVSNCFVGTWMDLSSSLHRRLIAFCCWISCFVFVQACDHECGFPLGLWSRLAWPGPSAPTERRQAPLT